MNADGGARDAYPVAKTWLQGDWNAGHIRPQDYECGFCGNQVGTSQGFSTTGNLASDIAICPRCNRPTFIEQPGGRRYPSSRPGAPVSGIPQDLADLYDEARDAAGACAYTAAVMVCRKMLMNIAVEKGAKEGLGFVDYVDYLVSKGYTPPDSKEWVDYVRSLGNEANHKIALKDEEDADVAIAFVGMLLRFIYEFPARIRSKGKGVQSQLPPRGNPPNPRPIRHTS